MADNKKSEPIKLPLDPTDALRALLKVKPPDKATRRKKNKGTPKKVKG